MITDSEIEQAAREYSESQFKLAESRTVSRYCNDETFAAAFEAGATWMREELLAEMGKLDKLVELIKES